MKSGWKSDSFSPTLLEKCLKAPVAGALWYRFFEPVPRKWYQRLEPLVPGKLAVPKASKIHEKYSLWLGFELATSSLARCSFTISATQFF